MAKWTLITVEEFEADSNAILERVEAGERFRVSRNGVVTMTVVPPDNHSDTADRA